MKPPSRSSTCIALTESSCRGSSEPLDSSVASASIPSWFATLLAASFSSISIASSSLDSGLSSVGPKRDRLASPGNSGSSSPGPIRSICEISSGVCSIRSETSIPSSAPNSESLDICSIGSWLGAAASAGMASATISCESSSSTTRTASEASAASTALESGVPTGATFAVGTCSIASASRSESWTSTSSRSMSSSLSKLLLGSFRAKPFPRSCLPTPLPEDPPR